VERSRAKDIIFAPSVLESKANNYLPILTITIQVIEDVVPMGHAGKNRVPPGVGTYRYNTVVGAIKKNSVASTPKVQENCQSNNVPSGIEIENNGL